MGRQRNANIPEDGYISKQQFQNTGSIAKSDFAVVADLDNTKKIALDPTALSPGKTLTLVAPASGSDINITLPNASGTLVASSGVVSSINKTGSAALTGAVTLTQGSNITLTQSGQDITVAAAASGVTGFSKSGGTVLTGNVTLSEGAQISLTQTGQNIAIAASGFAATDLSNLTTTVINQDLIPATDTGKALGNSTNRWLDVWTVEVTAGVAHALSLVGNAINVNNNKINNVTDPTSAQDAATKNYVDGKFVDYTARAHGSSTTISGTLATIVYGTKDYDASVSYNAGTGVYTAAVAGKYQVNASLLIAATVSLNNTLIMEIQKNGSVFSRRTIYLPAALTDGSIQISDILNCAATDTIQIQVSTSSAAPSIAASNFDNYISIAKVF